MIILDLVLSTSLMGLAILLWNFVINRWKKYGCSSSCITESSGKLAPKDSIGQLSKVWKFILNPLRTMPNVNKLVQCCAAQEGCVSNYEWLYLT